MKTETQKNRPSSIVNRPCGGFTLAEILVTLAVVLVLISASLRLGQYVRQRGNIQLTASMLAVIDTALQQYHTDHGAFPPVVLSLSQFGSDVGSSADYAAGSGSLMDNVAWPNQADWPSAGLFFFLDSTANSRSIIGALTGSVLTNNDQTNTEIVVRIPAGDNNGKKDLVRFIDTWGTSLWYLYDSVADSFPRVFSAGPDKVFGTPDDIENK